MKRYAKTFSSADPDNLDALIKIPQSEYFGIEQYPTLASKVAIIFYTLNKKHLFILANTTHAHDFQEIKDDLENWIDSHIVDSNN